MPAHFTPASITFLRGLIKHNDREWFTPRKPIYERELKAPMLALIEEINAGIIPFAPEHLRPANKIMMRIYRDTRFAADKRPYKRQISAWWARRGMEKTSGAGFYFHVSPKELLIAGGVFMPEREQLLAIRRWLAENHVAYRAMLKAAMKSIAGAPFTLVEDTPLTRMPKGFPADHPAGELLRAKNWGVHVSLPADLALQPTIARDIVKRFQRAAPIVDALNEAIAHSLAKPAGTHPVPGPNARRPLF